MHLVLDTSIVIELQRNNTQIINKIEELKDIYPAPPKIAFITYFEFLDGISNKSEKNQQMSRVFIELFDMMNITKSTAQTLITLRKKYSLPIPDLLIAAQTMENNGILLTKDKDFEKITEIEKIILSRTSH